jgi:hypothetical protein
MTACALTLVANIAVGASPADSVLTARLEVSADLDSAAVYLDTVHAGTTPLRLEAVTPGIHILRVVPPRPEEWTVQAVTDTVHLMPGRTHAVSYRLRAFVPILSDPPGAELYMNDSLAGVTPLLLKPSDIQKDTRLELRLKGFEPMPVLPSALTGETALTMALKGSWQGRPGEESTAFVPAHTWSARKVGMFVSGGVSLLAGIGAAYFKIAADEKQEAYLATGDPGLATDRKRLDTLAGVSLAFAQAGIIVLSYLLITE